MSTNIIRSFADLNSILIEPLDFEENQYDGNNYSNNDDSDGDYDDDDFEKDNDSLSRINIKKDNNNVNSASKRYVNTNDSNITNDSSNDDFYNGTPTNIKKYEEKADLEEFVDDDDDHDDVNNDNITNINTNINRELFVKNSIDVIAIDGANSILNIVTDNDVDTRVSIRETKAKTTNSTNTTNANANTEYVKKVISNIDATNHKSITNNTTSNDKNKDVYIVKAQNRKYYYSKIEPVEASARSSILQKADSKSKTITNNSKISANSIDASIKEILSNGDVSQEDLVQVVKSLLEKAIVETNKKEQLKRMENLAVRIPSASFGGVSKYDFKAMQWGQEKVLGVLDVDPDYEEAIKLKHFHKLNDTDTDIDNDIDDIKPLTIESNTRHAPSKSITKKQSVIDKTDEVDSIFSTIRGKELEARLLKLGLSFEQVSDKAETVYASFLSDLIGLCKRRSQIATSVEEMAMHKAIAEEIKKTFASREQIEIIRSNMIDAAIEVNLNRRV